MNILTKSIITLAALAATGLHAEVFPIAEDTFGTISKNTILKASGAAKSVTVSAKTKAYIGFDVGGSGIPASSVTGARLTVYIARATKTGTLYLANATGAFSETFTDKSIPMPTDAVISTTSLTDASSREFVTFDVTDQVKDWLTNPSSEHGFVLAADGTLALTIATKEGAGTGHPAVLEVDVINADANGNFIFSGGNVGIGTTTPGAKLEISDGTTSLQIRLGELNGVANASAISLEYPGFGTIGIQDSLEVEQQLNVRGSYYGFGHMFLYAFEGENNDGTAYVQARDNSGTSSIGLQLRTQNAGNIVDTMFLAPNGNVGIGTSNPTKAKLTLVGGNGSNFLNGSNGLLAAGGAGVVNNFTVTNNSIHADGNITAFQMFAFSDARIKNIIGRSDAATDLATLRNIEVTDYTHKDTLTKGTGAVKKVIAQQVASVFPQAVSKTTEIIPDIYKNADIKDGWVQLATDLKAGERVRIIDIKGESLAEVVEVKDGAFRTAALPESGQVFVYGREVKDFHTVDYDAISMLNVSATQELAQKVEARDAEIAALKTELAALKAANTSLETGIAARLAKLEAAASSTVTTTPVNSTVIDVK